MWKEYSSGYIKNNRSASLSVVLATGISALLLSLLCGIFYNLWKYEVESIQLEEGGWQSRIAGQFDPEELEKMGNFSGIEKAVVYEKEGREAGVELYFSDYGRVLEDTPRIAALAGVSSEKITYNHSLLALYFIRDPADPAPRLLFPLFLLIITLASLSLIVIIHSAFAVSMNDRIHQFGIFSSIGATPRQIRTCLLQEAAALCAIPVLAGNLLGIGISAGILHMANILLRSVVSGRHESVFGYHPLVLGVTLFATVLTIWISAWLPARKLSRLSPLEAIKNTGELQLKRKRSSRILGFLFGVEGELAGNALKAQRRALRTGSLSLICSFMAFTIMQCFFATSNISTRESYFQRYQQVWDVMVTVKDTKAEAFGETGEIQGLPGVESAIVYQRAGVKAMILEEELSEEMKAFGGFAHASESQVTKTDGGWLVNAPLVILDDTSFLTYCGQVGGTPVLNGAVVLNQIRDVTNPDFRHPQYMPYVKGEKGVSLLTQPGQGGEIVEIPVLSYTRQEPALREEYATLDYYELVHVIPVSLWKEIRGQLGEANPDLNICILGEDSADREELDRLQKEVGELLGSTYILESENRIREYEVNEKQILGLQVVFGGFCVLLAIIGIGNVFSNTLSFVRQRKREFARYLSVGVTPEGIRKMFCIEALVVAGRPILITLPLAVLAVWFMLRMSYLGVEEFLAEAPLGPIVIFLLAIVGSVALAYNLGWRNLRRVSLAEVLRDDTML
ncbi:MAG: ABC transporter permease [Lachnospiraceae bacterium]|nr:ABC transporter permease [Lachnospiraceae bacterium]